MIEVESSHCSGTVGYITGSHPRYQQFYDSLEMLRVPRETKLIRARGCNPAKNCNELVNGIEGDWLWILGDDHVWEPDCLLRLLDRKVDAVAPVVCRWGPPFLPVAYKVFDPEKKEYQTYSWMELSLCEGVLPVMAVGSAGLLVRRRVFNFLKKPYFRVGLTGQDELSEDLDFTWRINQAGNELFLDLDVQMGHITDVVMVPRRMKDGAFSVYADVHGKKTWMFQGVKPKPYEYMDRPAGEDRSDGQDRQLL